MNDEETTARPQCHGFLVRTARGVDPESYAQPVPDPVTTTVDFLADAMGAERRVYDIRPTHVGEMMTAVMDRLTLTPSRVRTGPLAVRLTGYTMRGASAVITDPLDGQDYELTVRVLR